MRVVFLMYSFLITSLSQIELSIGFDRFWENRQLELSNRVANSITKSIEGVFKFLFEYKIISCLHYIQPSVLLEKKENEQNIWN